MSKNNLKIFINKISGIYSKDKLKILISPYRDWKVLFFLSFVLLIIISVFNIYFFITSNKGQITLEGSEDVNNSVVLKVEELESTVLLFNKRAEDFEKLRVAKPTIVDPSR